MSSGIIKSPVDDREYRNFILPNDLEVLLVHDSTADLGAASLSVGVGSYEDPKDLPGLAHFLEHLLFMGTKKYPSESEYSQFLNEHGGHSNAYTAAEQTNFHFDVAWPHLRDTLDRFAQFFIEPLFSENSQNREIMAVDSENKRNLQNDLWRFFQLKKSLSNPDHPISKFSTGNYETLSRIPSEKGVNVRARLIEFYKQHYTSGIMKLCVIGRQPLDTLEQYVRECFSAVPNTHPEMRTKPSWYRFTPPLRPQDLGVVIRAKPVMDVNMLSLTFPIPDQQPLCDTSPYFYYLDLLGHESKGSLLYYLKEKRWATEISSVISNICKGYDHLYCNIELTNEGLEHWHEVLEAAFGYIEMVRQMGPQRWYFEEQKGLSEVNFIYRQRSRAMALATSLAQTLHRPIPRERLLNFSVVKRYDEQQLREFVNYLTVENVQVLLSSPDLQGLDKHEKWYGTDYAVEAIGKVTPLVTSEFHMPHPNEFLTTNFDLVREEGAQPACKQTRPRLLVNSPELRLWHKLEDQFKVPKANIFVKIIHSSINDSARHMRTADLFTTMINDLLNDYAYYADLAQVSMSLVTAQDGVEVEVFGFSEKLDKLLEVVLTSITSGELREERFNVLKEQQRRELSNLALAQPDAQRSIQTSYLLLEKMYPLDERLKALDSIEYSDLQEYARKFRSTPMGVEVLVCGNKTSSQARKTAELVVGLLNNKKDLSKLLLSNSTNYDRNTSFLFTPGSSQFRRVTLADPENVNSALFLAFQFGEQDLELSTILSIISHILKEATFEQLRTKEQLGYVVLSTKTQSRCTMYLNFLIQGEESSVFVENRVENYIRNVAWPLISEMTEDELHNQVEALRSELLEAPRNLNEESFRTWSAISVGYYDFHRRQRIAATAPSISKDQLKRAFEYYVMNKTTRTRFAVHLQSQKRKQQQPELVLARSVGQLATERAVPVSTQEIQQFMMECMGLTPQEALEKLAQTLVVSKGFTAAKAQEFVVAASHKAQAALVESQQADQEPLGEEITSLPVYYSQNVRLAARAKPLEPLEVYKRYEDGSKL